MIVYRHTSKGQIEREEKSWEGKTHWSGMGWLDENRSNGWDGREEGD